VEYLYTRPKLYPKQRDAFFNDKRYSFIEGSTKSGKTVGSMAWLLEQAIIGQYTNYLWVAPIYPQAKIAYSRFLTGLPKHFYNANAGDLFIELPNENRMWFKGGDNPNSIYGEDYGAAIIDEASRTNDAVWHAVRSTITATNGPLRAIGNVHGRHNWHYQMCRKAESGAPNMSYHKLLPADAIAAGVLNAEEIEDARRQLPEQVFRELYLAEPSDDGGNPFGHKAIESCMGEMSDKPPKWWGWDLAKSVDWTVGIALDEDGAVCRFERFQKPWLQTIPHIFEATGRIQAMVDSTGVGDPIVEQLQAKGNNFEGYKFTAASKQQLMEGLAVAIQQKTITFPEGVITMELFNFEYEQVPSGVRYMAPEGMHDDCVCALALAQRRRTAHIPGMGILEYYEGEYKDKMADDEAENARLSQLTGNRI
jgi:hypothetical protein